MYKWRLRRQLVVFSIGNLVYVLKYLAEERLTSKQKKILEYVRVLESKPVTPLVKELAVLLNCSQTAVWNNVTQLKRCGLVDYGSLKERGKHVVLSEVGDVICRGGENGRS